MAPPRPGWSRRAQYSLFFSFLALIAGIIVGLVLLALSLLAPKQFAAVRGAALDVTAPIGSALGEVSATFEGLVSGAGNYWDAARQNGRLRADRDSMRRQIVEAAAIRQENAQLKAALGLRERSAAPVASGRVIGSSLSSLRRFAILSVGSSEGVRPGMPVRAADGLVGRVLDAGATASRVMLISDKQSVIPGRMLRGGMPVLVEGRGDGTVAIRPLEVGQNPFRPRDIIVTSGTGGIYPPLVPVARVIRLDEYGAIGMPLADPSAISFAIVEQPFEPGVQAVEEQEAREIR